MLEILKAILFGIVEGITEWLPISSTGHMILLNEFVTMDVRPEFWDLFLVVIQLGAILAVVALFWKTIFPFSFRKGEPFFKKETGILWLKVLVACVPAAIVGLLFDEQLEALFYNYQTVATMLILFGVAFIIVEKMRVGQNSRVRSLAQITYRDAALIGVFQLIAAIFPGTSRSGATIVGALLLGVSRPVAAEFTFILAIPVMFGASLLKLAKFGFSFLGNEVALLLAGMITAFVVSLFVIRFLLSFIRKHDFKVFGWYRIALGAAVLAYFAFAA